MDVRLPDENEHQSSPVLEELNEGKFRMNHKHPDTFWSDSSHADGLGDRVHRRYVRSLSWNRRPYVFIRPFGPPTGEPDAGDPPVRFGGRGSPERGSPYPYIS